MGTSAYNRGSLAIRREIDAEAKPLPSGSKPLNWNLQRESYERRIAKLETELTSARRSVRSLRATLTLEREARVDAERDLESVKAQRAAWAKTALLMRRRWEFVSRIVRAYVTPEQVQEFRSENSDRK